MFVCSNPYSAIWVFEPFNRLRKTTPRGNLGSNDNTQGRNKNINSAV